MDIELKPGMKMVVTVHDAKGKVVETETIHGAEDMVVIAREDHTCRVCYGAIEIGACFFCGSTGLKHSSESRR